MARIEWVKARLENWARWCQQGSANGLGYPKQSAFARLAKPSGGDRTSSIPINDISASETDEAVKSLQLNQSHLYLVLHLTYEKNLTRSTVAKRMGKAESTISANLDAADLALKRWFDAKIAAKANTNQVKK